MARQSKPSIEGDLSADIPKPKAGWQSNTTRLLKEAALKAAEELGHQSENKDGPEGYLGQLAKHDAVAFRNALGKIRPPEITEEPFSPYRTREEIDADLLEMGIVIKRDFNE